MNNPWVEIEKPSADLNVRLVDEKHPLKLFWGVDSKNRYSFAFDAPVAALPDKRSLPALSGVEICVVPQGSRGKLLLLLQSNADWEIFFALCSDLIRATKSTGDETAGSAVILRRLQRWQELLRRTRPEMLSPEEIKGLMGELLFLRSPLAPVFGFDAAVTAWRGPEKAPQDFAFGETAIEVKCQAGSSRPVVRITSADQLCPQLPEGYLVVCTLARQTESSPDGFSLNTIVSSIRKDLATATAATRERFDDLIYLAGYVPREEYEDYKFSLVEFKSYHLVDGFPRVLASTLSPGIESVSYSIRLDHCAKFAARPAWWHSS
jgi:hypothetical protein